MSSNGLYSFFFPDSVAVVGASNTPGSIGNTAIKNFVEIDFHGQVYAVNPRYDSVEGISCFPSLAAIPDSVNVVIIAVASHLVEGAVRECVAKDVKYIVIFSSGFAESGEEGRQKQNELMALCQEKGIRVLGPNTLGVYNNHNKVAHSFIPVGMLKSIPVGEVGIVSQSGATGGGLFMAGGEEGIGYSYLATTGNQMDIHTCEFLEFMVEDESTKIIGLYLEAISNGEQLKKAAEQALNIRKPIVALKAGRSAAGQKAALSHTASMTGSSQIFRTSLDRYGMIIVEEVEELMDALKVFRSGKRVSGNRVATLVTSGAVGIMLADKLTDVCLEMAALQESTQKRLTEEVPSYCSVSNPVDIASAYTGNNKMYKHCIDALASAQEVDIVIVQLPMGGPFGEKLADEIIEVAESSNKLIIVALTSTELQQGNLKRKLTQAKVPAYFSLKSSATAASYLLRYEEKYERYHRLKALQNIQTAATKEVRGLGIGPVVTEPEVKELLNQFGIATPRGAVVREKSELLQLTRDLKYPLAAKIVSQEITHKSDVGGVILSIADEQALVAAYDRMLEQVRANKPDAQIKGVFIEEMVEGPFLEVFIGIKRDPNFGPILLCGLGGIYVEILKDYSQRAAPLSKDEAMEMLQELKSYPLFTGVRKGIAYDVHALAQALSQISQLALSLGDNWTELEINPLIVRPQGQGVIALDGLITIEGGVAV